MRYMRHGGEVCGQAEVLYDFSININPLGVPENVRRQLAGNRDILERYPDQDALRLREALAGFTGVPAACILCGNGASELIETAMRAIHPGRVLLTAPSFSGYRRAAENCHAKVLWHRLRREEGFALTERFLEELERLGTVSPAAASPFSHTEGSRASRCDYVCSPAGAGSCSSVENEGGKSGVPDSGPDMVVLCSPANPVGNMIEPDLLEKILHVCGQRGIWLLVDECFIGFTQEEAGRTMRRYLTGEKPPASRLLVLDAFTKRFGMPGLRLGYLMAADTKLLERIHALQPEWSVSGPAQAAGTAALEEADTYLERTRQILGRERPRMEQALRDLGFRVCRGEADFLFFSLPPEKPAGQPLLSKRIPGGNAGTLSPMEERPSPAHDVIPLLPETPDLPEAAAPLPREDLAAALLRKGILIRDCSNYPGLSRGDYRIAIKRPEENDILLRALREWRIRQSSYPR